MKGLMLLLVIAFLLGAVLMVRPASASFSFDETTETTCSGNVCTKTLYSGYSPAFFDNVISKSSNWLKYYNVVYLEKDSNFNLELTSFNDTNFVVHLNVPLSQKNKQIPLKLCDENGCSNVSILMSVLDRDVTVGMNPLLLDRISFGFNSTTIKLQTADSENLEDVRIGKSTVSDQFSMIKFNISSIPGGATITDAKLVLYCYTNGTTNDYDVNYYRLNNQTWREENNVADLWGMRTSRTNFTTNTNKWNLTYLNAGSPAWDWINVTSMVSYEYGLGNKNMSFWLEDPDENVTTPNQASPTAVYIAYSENQVSLGQNFRSKEYTTDTTLRPYLNVTYTESGGGTVYNATFNINSKASVNLYQGTFGFVRFNNINSKEYAQVSRNIILERTLNAKEKTSNTFSALLVAGLQTFERFLNIGTKAADSFFYMITGIRFLNIPTKDANLFNRNVIVTKFLNVSTKDKINFLRNTVVEKFLNISQKESNQFSRMEIISRLLNIREKMNVSWLSQLPYNIFERLLSIPLDLIDKFIVYVRVWEQPSIYQVCSILQQIGDSRAYLCIYDTGEWKILIRGV